MYNSEYLAHSEPLFKTLKLPKTGVYKLKLITFYNNLIYRITIIFQLLLGGHQ